MEPKVIDEIMAEVRLQDDGGVSLMSVTHHAMLVGGGKRDRETLVGLAAAAIRFIDHLDSTQNPAGSTESDSAG